jgi:hypothetical protein
MKAPHNTIRLNTTDTLAILIVFCILKFGQGSFAQSNQPIQEGEYLRYTPSSEIPYIKNGVFYYEVFGRRGVSQFVRATKKPMYVKPGVIYIDGEYLCHTSVVKGSLGSCTKSGWIPN